MNTEELRALQRPLMKKFLHDAASANYTLRAKGRLDFNLKTNAGRDQLDTLMRLTERYCVVLSSLRHPPSLTAGYGLKA